MLSDMNKKLEHRHGIAHIEYGSLRPPLGDGYSMEASGTIIIAAARSWT